MRKTGKNASGNEMKTVIAAAVLMAVSGLFSGCATIRSHFADVQPAARQQTALVVTCDQAGAKFRFFSNLPDAPDSAWMDMPCTLYFRNMAGTPGTDLYNGSAYVAASFMPGYVPFRKNIRIFPGRVQNLHIAMTPWPWNNLAVIPFSGTNRYNASRLGKKTLAELENIGCGIDLEDLTGYPVQNSNDVNPDDLQSLGIQTGTDAILAGSVDDGLELSILDVSTGTTFVFVRGGRSIRDLIFQLFQHLQYRMNQAG